MYELSSLPPSFSARALLAWYLLPASLAVFAPWSVQFRRQMNVGMMKPLFEQDDIDRIAACVRDFDPPLAYPAMARACPISAPKPRATTSMLSSNPRTDHKQRTARSTGTGARSRKFRPMDSEIMDMIGLPSG